MGAVLLLIGPALSASAATATAATATASGGSEAVVLAPSANDVFLTELGRGLTFTGAALVAFGAIFLVWLLTSRPVRASGD